MSVSGLKAELKFLASIFDKNHERFRIVSWKLDELHCQFLLPPAAPPGSLHSPSPPLTLHCNITVRRPGSAPRSQAKAERGPLSSRTKGSRSCRGHLVPGSPGRANPPLSPGKGPSPGPALQAPGLGGRRRAAHFSAFSAGLGLGLVPVGSRLRASGWKIAAALSLAGSPWLPTAGLLPGPREAGRQWLFEPRRGRALQF